MGKKSTLSDLNDHLFEQLERLNDDDLTQEQLEMELRRAEGMTKLADKIIANGELAYRTMKHMSEYSNLYENEEKVPPMLEVRKQ